MSIEYDIIIAKKLVLAKGRVYRGFEPPELLS
jgi:hypothetical protein